MFALGISYEWRAPLHTVHAARLSLELKNFAAEDARGLDYTRIAAGCFAESLDWQLEIQGEGVFDPHVLNVVLGRAAGFFAEKTENSYAFPVGGLCGRIQLTVSHYTPIVETREKTTRDYPLDKASIRPSTRPLRSVEPAGPCADAFKPVRPDGDRLNLPPRRRKVVVDNGVAPAEVGISAPAGVETSQAEPATPDATLADPTSPPTDAVREAQTGERPPASQTSQANDSLDS